MKKFFYLCMLALVPMFTFTACGFDDDDDEQEDIYLPGNGDNDDDDDDEVAGGDIIFNQDGIKITASDYEMIMTFTYYEEEESVGKVDAKAVAYFREDKCQRAYYSETYSTAEIARMVYKDILEDLDDDEDPDIYSFLGKTVTSDMTDQLAGASRQEVMGVFLSIAQENLHYNGPER